MTDKYAKKRVERRKKVREKRKLGTRLKLTAAALMRHIIGRPKKLSAVDIAEAEKRVLLRRMTNWQLTKWNWAGCPPDINSIRHFSTLQKVKR